MVRINIFVLLVINYRHKFDCKTDIFSAVCPYLALETCRQWRLSSKTVNLMRNGKMPTVTMEQAQKNFCKVSASLKQEIVLRCSFSLYLFLPLGRYDFFFF